jgi:hypothetical protein
MIKQAIGCFIILALCGCWEDQYVNESSSSSYYFNAQYYLSFDKVERPKSFNDRYSQIKTDTAINNQKYNFYFEDSIFQILWLVTSTAIGFYINNKTDHSLKIMWDDAAFVDQNGTTHRVMHTGVKYSQKDQAQPPSVIVRKGNFSDIVQPTDYVYFKEATEFSSASWEENPLLENFDYHSELTKGKYPTLEAFTIAVKANVGKTIQVLLPVRIEETTNDYIFSFKVDSVSTKTNTK